MNYKIIIGLLFGLFMFCCNNQVAVITELPDNKDFDHAMALSTDGHYVHGELASGLDADYYVFNYDYQKFYTIKAVWESGDDFQIRIEVYNQNEFHVNYYDAEDNKQDIINTFSYNNYYNCLYYIQISDYNNSLASGGKYKISILEY